MRAFLTRMMTLLVEANAPETKMADAALASAAAKWVSFSAKVRSPGTARSAELKPVSATVPSPMTSPSSCSAMWAAV